MDLDRLVRRLVVLLPGDRGAMMDITVLREVTGLPFELRGPERQYIEFRSDGNLLWLSGFDAKGKFSSSGSVEMLLKLERRAMTAEQYAALRKRLLPKMLAYAEHAPRTFNGGPFRMASAAQRSAMTRSMAFARWGEVVTGDTVRVLHARMLAGDTQSQAAAVAGMSGAAASMVRRRMYGSWSDEIEAAWHATFGAQPVGDPARRAWKINPGKRNQRDAAAATRLRQLHALLTGDQPRTQAEAAEEMGLTRSQITKIMRRDPSKWGKNSASAWRETFGAPADGPRRRNFR